MMMEHRWNAMAGETGVPGENPPQRRFVHHKSHMGSNPSHIGALNLTREAHKRSQKAQDAADATEKDIADSERQCKRTEALVNRTSQQFFKSQEENEDALGVLGDKIKELEKEIPLLNEMVCDKQGNPCDALCGGAGCGTCGGLSCENGAVTKADRTIRVAEDAEKTIREKETKAEELLRGISQAKQETVTAKEHAREAYNAALQASTQSDAMLQERANLTEKLEEFHNRPGAVPAEIRTAAQEALKKDIYLRPEQITSLTSSINETIASLTDINTILNDTREDLELANELKRQADSAKADAEGILETAQRVVSALDEASEAQDKAEEAIQKAHDDIASAEKDLAQIASETGEAQQKANETVNDVDVLQGRLKELQTRFLKNDRDAREVREESDKVGLEAKQAKANAMDLGEKYQEAADKLAHRSEESDKDRSKAQSLLERASQFSISTLAKLKELNSMKDEYDNHESTLSKLADMINELNGRLVAAHKNINMKSKYYRTCVS